MNVGRPSIYTQELADRICDLLSDGLSLRKICLMDEMPDKSTVFRWLRTEQGFSDQYARAKQEGTDAWAEELHDIVDDVSEDKEAINKARLRVDTRKWLMSKMKPKKYGEKLDVTSDGKALPAPITTFNGIPGNNSNQEDRGTDQED